MDFDHRTRTHYEFHRAHLLTHGIEIDIDYQIAHRIGLRVQQVDHLDTQVGEAELRERVAAIFRFLPYHADVRVLPPGRSYTGPVGR